MFLRLISIFLWFPLVVNAQIGWTWTELDTMPEPISNNAVTHGTVAGVPYVYSFSGIDTSKTHSGISLKSFRYNTQTSVWETISPLPDTMGKVAAGASTVNNKIYIIGGYHVKADGTEVSSSKVHRYDPETNSYLADGTDIPVPIDDQVQCVWRDSLIYVITGWSNTSNVTDVQIYNPSSDQWLAGTPTPNQTQYKMFGASGVIIGDTIYYNGGVTSGFSFNATNYLRKGIIDSNDPTQITWTQEQNNPGDKGYRMAAAKHNNRCFWIGGAGVAYNYNGIAYNGSGGVEPLNRILTYESDYLLWKEGLGAPYGVMDLRGIAEISPTSWIICGGMLSGQQVTNKTFLLEFDPVVAGISENQVQEFQLWPNPVEDQLIVIHQKTLGVSILDMFGRTLLTGLTNETLDVSTLPRGAYIVRSEGFIQKVIKP